ncbi:RNA polymerase sigma-70 factor, ECF subfamily [Desulfonatronum thiosulfatophilum]|uniref:RNA polymerase sigma-70 factor, ECF subfamily n=1 Tax=Desulfonatronum thiosulfatophilum TaxID=617002 RepID=A0A1G6CNA7_9BACT|nr:sigma-70 family RNA polymerase sigma factor [Desulfonatronum thiosulfatophilum]SDB34302.1 RNA polymerase sigma-70 factor, ECF subfamily [Desulfonatronum thiosulfatophilum]
MEDKVAKALVREVLQGQTPCFAELVKGFESPVYNLALRMTGSPADAADLSQETFVRAWLHLDKYDLERKFFTWLYTLSLNLIRNHLAKTGRAVLSGQPHPDRELVEEARNANPAQSLAAKQDGLKVQDMLQRLPLEQREALLLRFFQDVSFKDMAVILGVTTSAAKMRVRRGLETMRRMGDE